MQNKMQMHNPTKKKKIIAGECGRLADRNILLYIKFLLK
jgi:hypothetical protein